MSKQGHERAEKIPLEVSQASQWDGDVADSPVTSTHTGVSVQELDRILSWKAWEYLKGGGHLQVSCAGQLRPGVLPHLCVPPTYILCFLCHVLSVQTLSHSVPHPEDPAPYAHPFPHHMCMCPHPNTHTLQEQLILARNSGGF